MNDKYHLEPAHIISGNIIYLSYPIKKILYRGKSKYQEICVAETPFGKTLILDGVLQFTVYDEEIYHTGLIHPVVKHYYRRILVLGGGDGGAAREIRKVLPSANIKVVDIDPEVTNIVQEYIPEVPAGIFDDKYVELINMDAHKYIANTQERFDLIVGDLTDIRDEALKGSEVNILYTREFLSLLKDKLKRGGRVVYHVGGLNLDPDLIHTFWECAKSVFKYTVGYGIYIPSFLDIWCYIVMSEYKIKLNPIKYRYIKLKYCEQIHKHTPICFLR